MKNTIYIYACLMLLIQFSCTEGKEFDELQRLCSSELKSNFSFANLDQMATEETVQVQENLVIEGYIISSDKAGNFFNVVFLQDAPVNPTKGLQLEMDLRESHLQFPIGSKVLIKLKDLYLQKKNENILIGSVFSSFGNISVGRLPAPKVKEHVFLACEDDLTIQPLLSTISKIDSLSPNILVQLEDVEFVDEELGELFALAQEETERHIQNCEENVLAILNSGYADFQSEPLPTENGTITGVLLRDKNKSQLVIRDLDDVDFNQERCPEIITEFTSDLIFISELADPENNSGARFVELYNAGSEPLDLNLWSLRRYTNDNIEVSSTIDLSGLIIGPESTLVISPNATEFELVYGFSPDLGVGTNSPADSNGDDNLELVDPFGTVIDVFGIIGEDGSGTNHEFEDGRAIRNMDVVKANSIYTFSEWTIYNDTGDAGTINLPQQAPQDFTPGQRN
ncbi:DUF5689 domain-containing protein [Flagellimonas zhangzhouensis]|uniref:Lamin Tail Domain n=1 Tax=Flagellimonas zhangzhouensis TaxID=1073328 RepID=A0A1H2V7C5_9FLAO|nr:DUF5689 domain-containing protein [Allomuricauda zhangzhouensis]SDQ10113.1 Lamin Tail Domain [Allomuricauda zhangzhouensis]SDW64195.1 Lamin Tail Domain [Allomuricauda zhangzhouensis]